MAYWVPADATGRQKTYIAQLCMALKEPGLEYLSMSKGSAGRHIRFLEAKLLEKKRKGKARSGHHRRVR